MFFGVGKFFNFTFPSQFYFMVIGYHLRALLEERMRKLVWTAVFIVSVLFPLRLYSNQDWYSYYVQCVAVSSDEASCYQPIREFLQTEEGKRQAEALGFKRKLSINSREVSSQFVIVLSRVAQMDQYLSKALDRAKEQGKTIQGYCLAEKKDSVVKIKTTLEQRKSEKSSVSESREDDYQVLLSLNARANEIYQQAQKCLLTE
ncbi:MAG: hypothetical protein EBQ85_08225 [Proteobacteria bacterium]|nr:hypothetical protein [Pseudomonadota bacterium]